MFVKNSKITIDFDRDELYTIGCIIKDKIFDISKTTSKSFEEFWGEEHIRKLTKMCSMFLELCGWGEGNAMGFLYKEAKSIYTKNHQTNI